MLRNKIVVLSKSIESFFLRAVVIERVGELKLSKSHARSAWFDCLYYTARDWGDVANHPPFPFPSSQIPITRAGAHPLNQRPLLHIRYDLGMVFREVIAIVSLIARAIAQPGPTLDLYIKDRYVVVSKRSLIGLILAVPLTPLAVIVLIRWLR